MWYRNFHLIKPIVLNFKKHYILHVIKISLAKNRFYYVNILFLYVLNKYDNLIQLIEGGEKSFLILRKSLSFPKFLNSILISRSLYKVIITLCTYIFIENNRLIHSLTSYTCFLCLIQIILYHILVFSNPNQIWISMLQILNIPDNKICLWKKLHF